jgi:hypothetical protein
MTFLRILGTYQGCQMVYLQTNKIPIWVNFGVCTLGWKMLIYFMVIWNILRTFGLFYDHLVHFVFIWYILCFMYQENLATLAHTLFLTFDIGWWHSYNRYCCVQYHFRFSFVKNISLMVKYFNTYQICRFQSGIAYQGLYTIPAVARSHSPLGSDVGGPLDSPLASLDIMRQSIISKFAETIAPMFWTRDRCYDF